MSIHAQLDPTTIEKIEKQKKQAVITSALLSVLSIILVGLVFTLIFIEYPTKKVDEIQAFNTDISNATEPPKPKITTKQQKPSSSSSSASRVITSSAISPISIPVPKVDPDLPSTDFGNSNDFGNGWGDGSGDGIGSGQATKFGSSSIKVGLEGTFYDYKRDQNNKPTGVQKLNRPLYTEIIKEFTKGRNWGPSSKRPCFVSSTKLYSKIMLFEGMPDTQAGAAFQCPESEAGMWVAHYKGTVTVQEAGTYRLVGWGDNCLVVGVNGNIALDASDVHYTGESRIGHATRDVKGKPSAMVFEGKKLNLRRGQKIDLDVVLGDEGGIFSAAVFLLKEGDKYSPGSGMPDLPAFVVAELSPEEIQLYPDVKPKNLQPNILKIR